MGNVGTRPGCKECVSSCPSCYDHSPERIEYLEDPSKYEGAAGLARSGLVIPVFSTMPGDGPKDDAAKDTYTKESHTNQLLEARTPQELKAQLDAAASQLMKPVAKSSSDIEPGSTEDVASNLSRVSSWSMGSEDHDKIITNKAPLIGRNKDGCSRGATQPVVEGRRRKDGTPVENFGGFEEAGTLDDPPLSNRQSL
mmetsp:Transcript_85963/g.135731  ORF Transcript_85963/g.135731 Transcript_85963/m.135731 type:complete len:197 (-) Transcript_85963:67-657(-)